MHKVSLFAALCMLGVLAGCTPEDLTPVQRNTICNALVGPIRYNTYDPTSGRYSGHVLALDLKVRNQIGQALHCPQYKVTYGRTSRVQGRSSKHR
jgi:hypothetical protein